MSPLPGNGAHRCSLSRVNTRAGRVAVVVTGHDAAVRTAAAVRSALAQGPAVAEVIAVDDASLDGTEQTLRRLADGDPRLRVLRREERAGGSGTPRNDGLRAASCHYLMFLDSDDLLPEGAVDLLLAAADRHDADVTAGLCVHRAPAGRRDTPWRPELHTPPGFVTRPCDDPRLAGDTLAVNKLYRAAFLREHGITFPEGEVSHPDPVFTARVLAAAPRVAVIPQTVCVRQTRLAAARPADPADPAGTADWAARIEAHRQAVAVHTDAGDKTLARAARAGFLDGPVRDQARRLGGRRPRYRTEWWRLTREYLAGFEDDDLTAAQLPARVIAGVVLAAAEPRDLPRLAALAARPPRLLPPYAEGAWSEDLPQVALDDLAFCRISELPLAVEALLETGVLRGRLRLRVHDLCGRLAAARPIAAGVRVYDRAGGEPLQSRTAALTADGGSWTAETPLDLPALAAGRRPATAELRVTLHCAGGERVETVPQAVPRAPRRTVLLTSRGALLVCPHATVDGALVVRVTPALRGAVAALRRRPGR